MWLFVSQDLRRQTLHRACGARVFVKGFATFCEGKTGSSDLKKSWMCRTSTLFIMKTLEESESPRSRWREALLPSRRGVELSFWKANANCGLSILLFCMVIRYQCQEASLIRRLLVTFVG